MADLERAALNRADLSFANFRQVDLHEANITGAILYSTTFVSTNVKGATFRHAQFDLTTFGDMDLSAVRGLKQTTHNGPSTIGIDTLYRSKGKIPEAFLRGAGVPDNFIAYAKSLATNLIEFYSCFISYSSHNQDFAERLHADLVAKNLRCWFARKT